MNKELELWYRIVEYLKWTSRDKKIKYGSYDDKDGCYIAVFQGYPISIIENALKEKIELEEENKALIESNDLLNEALIEDQKKLKALEIIKNKKVNLEYLKCCQNYEQYITICSYGNEITEEEFDLLKEVLK